MPRLAEGISVRSRFARSASLERDIARPEPLDGYVVTARALDVVERVAETAATGTAGGAWSLTGPYGSGKSSLALVLDAAFGDGCDVRGHGDPAGRRRLAGGRRPEFERPISDTELRTAASIAA